jgi:hypothetical protein
MQVIFKFTLLFALITLLVGACGDDSESEVDAGTDTDTDSDTDADAGANLPAPVNVAAVGSLNLISLSWDAVADATGYDVYRNDDGGASFTKITVSPITEVTYDDTISSPDGDGILYYYYIAAVFDSDLESKPSVAVKQIHGTRLEAAYPDGVSLGTTGSPWVAEGTTVIGDEDWTLEFVLEPDAKLYVLGGAVIDIETGRYFYVGGLLRFLSSETNPATITSHATGGGTPGNGDGVLIVFDDTLVDYNASDDSGTLIQYAYLENLNPRDGIEIWACAPKIYNVKASAGNGTHGYPTGRLELNTGANPTITNSSFEGMYLSIKADLSAEQIDIQLNEFTEGYYAAYSSNTANITAGHVQNNVFNSDGNAGLSNVSDGITVPLGGNFWPLGTGTPPVPPILNLSATTATYNFSDPVASLNAAPVGVGPTW